MRHLTRSGVTLASLAEAEPVAVRELRFEGPDGAVVVPYLLFRTRYGYHAEAGDWRGLTTEDRTWLLAHEALLNLALARDVEAVDADARSGLAGNGMGRVGRVRGNGHLSEGVVRVQAGDSVGGGGPDMEDEHGGAEPGPAGPIEPGAGDGRDIPAAPGDVPEGVPVPDVIEIEALVAADLTVSSLAWAIDELVDRINVRRPFQLVVHRWAVHLAEHLAFRLFGMFWRDHVTVIADETQLDEDAWALESGGWRYHNPGA